LEYLSRWRIHSSRHFCENAPTGETAMSRMIGLSFGLFAAILLVGCGSYASKEKPAVSQADGAAQDQLAMKRVEQPAADQFGKDAVKAEAAGMQRKIIYTANLDIVVTDFDKARKDLEKLIEDTEAYIAKSEFTGNIGAKRTGHWTIRVPVGKFHSFIAAVTGFGMPQRHSTDAQDVTEEYVDVQALIKNLKEEEETLNRLLKENAKSFTDIQVWKEKIALVRRDIGRYEARLQTLGRLSAMSTVYLTLKDEKDYLPDTSPAHSATASKTLDDSWKALKYAGEWIFIILVAMVPWLPFILLALLVAWRSWKRRATHLANGPRPSSGGRLAMPEGV
jgi:Domain of unknown function (DUF4349)